MRDLRIAPGEKGEVVEIVDAQVHLWRAEDPRRPWPSDRPESKPTREPLEPPELLGLMDEQHVARAVIVPPLWAGEDNDTALGWVADYPDRFAVMGRFDPWAQGKADLERLMAQPGMLGIRMSYPSRRAGWLDVDGLAWFWQAAQDLNIPLMVLCQGEAGRVAPIARRYPDLTIVVDHLGLQPFRATTNPFETFEGFLDLASFPKVYGKFSSLPYYSREPFPYLDLAPNLERAVLAFGPERLMWGSDISRMSLRPEPPTYAETLAHTRSLDFLDADALAWILGRTALTTLGWQ